MKSDLALAVELSGLSPFFRGSKVSTWGCWEAFRMASSAVLWSTRDIKAEKVFPAIQQRPLFFLSPERRRKVAARAAELIAEEMTLRDFRKARKLTQVRLARRLGITQDGVSRLEKRSDLLLSTLRETVEAMGGNLSLVAQFPDGAPVVLLGIVEEESRT